MGNINGLKWALYYAETERALIARYTAEGYKLLNLILTK